jgi:hypothetical protein
VLFAAATAHRKHVAAAYILDNPSRKDGQTVKKILAMLLIAGVMVTGAVGCGGGTTTKKPDEKKDEKKDDAKKDAKKDT